MKHQTNTPLILNILRICDDLFLCFHHTRHQMDVSSFWMSDEPTTCWCDWQLRIILLYLHFVSLPEMSSFSSSHLFLIGCPSPQNVLLCQPCTDDAALTHFSVTFDIFCVVFYSDCLQILCFISCCFIVFYVIPIVSPWAPQVVRLQLQCTWCVLHQVSCRDAFFILTPSVAVTVNGGQWMCSLWFVLSCLAVWPTWAFVSTSLWFLWDYGQFSQPRKAQKM